MCNTLVDMDGVVVAVDNGPGSEDEIGDVCMMAPLDTGEEDSSDAGVGNSMGHSMVPATAEYSGRSEALAGSEGASLGSLHLGQVSSLAEDGRRTLPRSGPTSSRPPGDSECFRDLTGLHRMA